MSDYVENTISHSSWLTLEKVTPEFKTLTLFGKKLLRAYVVLFYYVPNQNKVFLSYLMSEEATVDSGVPQGTVLGPLLFLYHINDLPDSVSSSVKLFADDCLLYGNIRTQDHTILQEDLQKLEVCAKDWGMRLNNAKKCYILRDRPFNLKGGYGFLFRPEFFFRTTQELKYFVFVAQSAKFCSRI